MTPDAWQKTEVRGHERLTSTFLEGLTDVVPTESSTIAATGTYASKHPGQDRVVRPSVETGERKSDAAVRGEHRKHPDHEGSISGRHDFANAGGPGTKTA